MIGHLEGVILAVSEQEVLLKTASGVGYDVRYGHETTIGQDISLFIHHHFTEHEQKLWGFRSLDEKKIFELLISVNKVGPAKAYPLLMTLGISGVINSIMSEDAYALAKAPGIGAKMAEQIILSLKDKMAKVTLSSPSIGKRKAIEISERGDLFSGQGLIQDTVLALETLGYKGKDIMPLVKANLSSVGSSEELIKIILREL